ncbi:TadE/TadG family type IV pilus assembly protein [Bradyrhizobium lablabi]|uniref:vWA domain-containing protein n=1 Tax=Bradyrhizobium lablabi TaxID=722472 RepID=UPI001BA473D3|nr:TadE/TadG family type IV pilus assembly protein [Bradyrhizobium lablabi]MBR0692838.1 pilus assembly protein [Bradyrhizobium lablabi]
MSGSAIFNRVRSAAGRFSAATDGNIAVLFAIAAVPIISFMGAAIDYSRANKARSSMQAALDSTALMLAKDLTNGDITAAQIPAKAQAYFTALYTNTEAQSVTVNASYTQSGPLGSTVQVNGSGLVKTDFMKLAGYPNLNFDSSSTSAWGNVRMRVAMALDNTGSMADDGKMPALKNAVAGTNGLIDQLSALAKNNGDIYISVVPFAKDVNYKVDASGASNVNQPWIDWSLWDVANGSWGTCSRSTYTTKSTCESNGKKWTPDHSKWTGCFTDRAKDYDVSNTTPVATNTATLFPAEEYVSGSEKYCSSSNNPYLQPIMPLTYNWSSLKTRVNDMEPTGNTNQGIGLAWAWMTLGDGAPFDAPPKDPNYTYKDAIILLSDGMNTQNRYSSTASQIDAREKMACDNAKAAGITIYTVQVNTGTDPTSAVLQYCASGSDKFYLVTSATQTASVFNSIGQSLSRLRVAR